MADRVIVTAAETTREYTRKGEGDVLELKDGRLLLVYLEFTGDGSDVARGRHDREPFGELETAYRQLAGADLHG